MSATQPHNPRRENAVQLLDRARWVAAASAVAYSVRFGIRTNDHALLDDILSCLSPGSTLEAFSEQERIYSLILDSDEPRQGRRYAVFRDRSLVGYASEKDGAHRLLGWDAQLFVAEMAPDFVFVHAGVVGWRGRAIILPGRSFAGKSTLVLGLVRAGAEYYSDEYALIDPQGLVHPYPRILSLREDMGGAASVTRSADCLGRIGTVPLSAGLVLVCKFRKGGLWNPEPMTPGAAALALMANTVPARRVPDVVMATLHRVVASVPTFASERGEAVEVVSSILNMAKAD